MQIVFGLCGLWRLWKARNDFVFYGARPQLEVVVSLMMQWWSEFNDATRAAMVQTVGTAVKLNMEAAGIYVAFLEGFHFMSSTMAEAEVVSRAIMQDNI
ncbi:hypothetical protein ACFX13_003993 [Malus domestica]